MAEWRVGQVTLGELIEIGVFWRVSGTASHSLADWVVGHHYPVPNNMYKLNGFHRPQDRNTTLVICSYLQNSGLLPLPGGTCLNGWWLMIT